MCISKKGINMIIGKTDGNAFQRYIFYQTHTREPYMRICAEYERMALKNNPHDLIGAPNFPVYMKKPFFTSLKDITVDLCKRATKIFTK